jgi:mono/diheme cytochrome c family protein
MERMNSKRATSMVCLAVFVVVLGVSAALHDPQEWKIPEAARKMKNPVPNSAMAVAAGKSQFTTHCVECHGETGKGDGPDAMMYTPEPADLTDAKMMKWMTDGEIFYIISEGHKPMPSFKDKLTETQRWQLVHFVRTFTPEAKPASKPAAPAPKSRKP